MIDCSVWDLVSSEMGPIKQRVENSAHHVGGEEVGKIDSSMAEDACNVE